ncbi:YibE/F family protein [Enterococcus sp. AZ109]|uniref:YibE/F family protein n=1 Tax=Enterococcus sp. AZ109 TaxID=2774634 RepID=UPI003F24E2BE
MSVLGILMIIFILLTLVIFAKQGFYIILGLFINMGLFLLLLLLLYHGVNVYFSIAVVFLLLTSTTLFFVNGWNQKTQIACLSVMIFVILFACIFLPLIHQISIQGFAIEELEELAEIELNVPLNFSQMTVALILLSFSGAVIDSSMAVVSAAYEVKGHNQQLSFMELVQSNLRVVGKILNSTVNTLLFAFLANNLALVFWLSDLNYSFVDIINSKAFVSEIVVALLTGLGAVMILPLTAYLASYFLTKKGTIPL